MEQTRLRKFFLSPWFLIAAQIVSLGAVVAAAAFYTYANVIVYRLWKIALIDLTFVFCSGAMLAVTFLQKEPEAKAVYLLIPFLVGVGIFAALFFGVQAILNLFVNRTISCLVGISLPLAFVVACVVAQDVFAVKRNGKLFLAVGATLAIAVYVGALFLSLLILPHGWAFKSFSKVTHEFESASAETYQITAADRNAGKRWLTESLVGATPAFDFRLGGELFSEHLADYSAHTVTNETSEQGDVVLTRTYTHTSGVEACVEGRY